MKFLNQIENAEMVKETTEKQFVSDEERTKWHEVDSKADNSRVLTDVPLNAKFTDTITTVNGKTGAITKADITSLGIPAQDTVTPIANNLTETAAGKALDATQGKALNELISTNLTRKNLLHNWDFRNPVNQRGQSSYSTTTVGIYTIDRWVLVSTNGAQISFTVNSGSVTMSNIGSAGSLFQLLENPFTEDTQITASINVLSETYCLLRIRDLEWNTYAENTSNSSGILSATGTIPAGKTLRLQIIGGNSNSLTFDKIKLELGSTSTLANDPPADYGEQLSICKPIISTNTPINYLGEDGQWQTYA